MPDKRREKRKQLIYYLRVVDRNTDKLFGQLVDITTEGMKLVSEKPVEPDTTYELKMLLPEEIENRKEVYFEANCQWCKRDVNPNFYSIGFEFIRISTQDINIIKNLIYDFSFRD